MKRRRCWTLVWAALAALTVAWLFVVAHHVQHAPVPEAPLVAGPAACACGLCVAPRLRLATTLRVHVFTTGRERPETSWRFRHLLDQGLAAHPRVTVVSREEDADVVLWLPQWTNRIPAIREPRRRLVILDEHDDRARRDGGYKSEDYLAYYKRSFVRKADGAFAGLFEAPLGARTYALPYSISDAYLSSDNEGGRPLDIVCTLRVGQGVYPARARVLAWARAYAAARNLSGYFGEVTTSTRTALSPLYLKLMRAARVVVTCNPGDWEGDFRTWEALASGAAVVRDRLYAPTPHGDFGVVYDARSKASFDAAMDRAHADAGALGRRALTDALAHHRAISRVDWLLASATSAAAGATDDARALAPLVPPPVLPRPPPVSPEVLADLRQPLFVRPDGRAFRGAAARREAGAFVGEL